MTRTIGRQMMRPVLLLASYVSSAAIYELPPQNVASFKFAGANSSLHSTLCAPICHVSIDPARLPSPAAVPGSPALAVDVTAALNVAIENASNLWLPGGAPCVVQLPSTPGYPYVVSSTVRFASGVILNGSPNATILISGLAKFTAFSFSGSPSVLASMLGVKNLTGAVIAVSAEVAQAAASALLSGKRAFVSAFMANDHELLERLEPVYSREASGWDPPWAANSRGHVVEVRNADAATGRLTLRSAIPMVLDNATLHLLDGSSFVTDAGMAHLALQRLPLPPAWVEEVKKEEEGSDGMQSIQDFIATNYAADVLLHALELSGMTRSGVWLTTSAHVTVSASYFHGAQLWYDTGGGQGYGLVAGQWTTASKIEDNSFCGMRHSMMVKQGANTNVFGYNWSDDVRGANCVLGVCLPFPTVDLDSHGHWGHHNLWEGNTVRRMAASDWWGPCPSNVFFKNHAAEGVQLNYASTDVLLLDNAVAEVTASANCGHNLTCVGNFACSALPCSATRQQPSIPAISSAAERACAAANRAGGQDERPRSYYTTAALDSCNACFDAPAVGRRGVGVGCGATGGSYYYKYSAD